MGVPKVMVSGGLAAATVVLNAIVTPPPWISLATVTSNRPSPFMSASWSDRGLAPTDTVPARLKLPLPPFWNSSTSPAAASEVAAMSLSVSESKVADGARGGRRVREPCAQGAERRQTRRGRRVGQHDEAVVTGDDQVGLAIAGQVAESDAGRVRQLGGVGYVVPHLDR